MGNTEEKSETAFPLSFSEYEIMVIELKQCLFEKFKELFNLPVFLAKNTEFWSHEICTRFLVCVSQINAPTFRQTTFNLRLLFHHELWNFKIYFFNKLRPPP